MGVKLLRSGSRRRTTGRLFLAGVLVAFALPGVSQAELVGEVTKVVDGDTIDVEGERVRLQGVDTPEANQPYGEAATHAVRAKIGGDRVRVTTHGRGHYGRIIGTVFQDGTNINAWLVRNGHAWVYDRYNDNPKMPDWERQARQADRGLWRRSNPTPPWEWRETH